MRLLRLLLGLSRGRLLLSACSSVLAGASCAALVALVHHGIRTRLADYGWVLAAFVASWGVYVIASLAANWSVIKLSQLAVFKLRVRVCTQVLSSPLRVLERAGLHRVLTVLTEDIGATANGLQDLPLLLVNLTMIAGCLVYLGCLSPPFLAVSLAAVALGALLFVVPFSVARRDLDAVRRGWDELFQRFQSMLAGIKELLMHSGRRRAFLQEGIEETCHAQMQATVRSSLIHSGLERWGEQLLFLALGLILFLLPRFGWIGYEQLGECLLVLLFALGPLSSVANTGKRLERINAALRHIEELDLRLLEEGPPPLIANDAQLHGPLRLEQVELRRAGEGGDPPFVLGPLSLTLQPGETVFLVGGNGSGKSTLARLLCGLYPPDSGRIWVGETLVSEALREAHRQLCSVVFSDAHVFQQLWGLGQGPGLEGPAQAELERLQLSERIHVHAGRFSTVAVSGGQRKRLALATALLEDRPVYVFDEWAADQDPEFRRLFYEELLPSLKAAGKSVLAITHDDAYFHVADRIVKLAEGRVVEQSVEQSVEPSAAPPG